MHRTSMANGKVPLHSVLKNDLSVDDALQLLNDRQNATSALNSMLQKEMGDRKVADSYQAFRVRYLSALSRLYPATYESREDLTDASQVRSHMRKLRQQGKEKKARYDALQELWQEYDSVATDKPEVLSAEDKQTEKQLDEMEEDVNEAWRNFAQEVIAYAEQNGDEKRDYVEEWKQERRDLKRDLKLIKQRHAAREEMRKRAEIRRIEDIVRARRGPVEEESEEFSVDESKKTTKSKKKKKNGDKKSKKDKSKKGESDTELDGKLLEEVFPPHIAQALREGRRVEPEEKECVTIFFSDIVGFTNISSSIPPLKVSDMLDRLYQRFDALARKHEVFKVETIGDSWMGATNLTKEQPDHANIMAHFAIAALKEAQDTWIDEEDRHLGKLNLRVGFHSGPVVANVVGSLNPRYCLFGDTINVASRMESNSKAGKIQCSKAAASLIHQKPGDLMLRSRGEVDIKGKGLMETFWVGDDESAFEGLEEENEPTADKPSEGGFRRSVKKTFSGGLQFLKAARQAQHAQEQQSEADNKSSSRPSVLRRWKKPANSSPEDIQAAKNSLTPATVSNRRASINTSSVMSKSHDKPSRRASADGSELMRSEYRKGNKRKSLLDGKKTKSSESSPTGGGFAERRASFQSAPSSPRKSGKKTADLKNHKRAASAGTATMTKVQAIGALLSENAAQGPKEVSDHNILKAVEKAPERPMSKPTSPHAKAKTIQRGNIDKILARCIESLKNKELSAEVSIKTINEIYEMAKANETRQVEFGQGSGIELLVDCMERHKSDISVLEAALRLTSILAQVEPNRDELALHGAVDFILKAMKKHSSSPDVLQWGLYSLANLSQSAEYQNQIISHNGLDVIMEVQKANSRGKVEVACFRTLRALARNNKANALNIAANGGIWSIIGFLQAKNFPLETVIDLHIQAFSALAEFAREAEPNRVSIAAAGGVPTVIGATQCFSKNGDLVEAGIDALYCMSKDNVKNSDSIVAYDGIKIITNFMKKHTTHEGVQEKGVLAIGTLLDKSNTGKFMTPDDCIATVKHALELHKDNGALQAVGRELLDELS